MTDLTILASDSNEQTMTSREMAKLTNTRHYDLKRKVLSIIEALTDKDYTKRNFSFSEYIDGSGKANKEIIMTKSSSLFIASRYDVNLHLAVQKKWQELENQKPPQLPKTYLEAMKAHVLQLEMNEEQKVIIDGLEQSLDISEQWLSILRVSKDRGVSERSFKWQVLKRKSIEMGIEIKKTSCPRFGFKNLYHVAVFKECYPVKLPKI